MSSSRLAAGEKVGPYEVVALLGRGVMGEVYQARDTRLSRDVALKVLHGEIARDPARLRRFEQEAKATGALNHPNIVAVYDTAGYMSPEQARGLASDHRSDLFALGAVLSRC